MANRSGAAVQTKDHPTAYYSQSRPEVADLVPSRCRRVLDVGCGEGALGRVLKQRGHHVSGIELVPAAAAIAQEWLDDVRIADIEGDGFPYASESFDAVIFADVLEHLIDPWHVLKEAAGLLTSGGCVVASIPNLQNWDVLKRLAFGRWQYRDRGITDFGHLRFFVLQTIRGMFNDAGLTITHVGYQYRRSWSRAVACLLSAGYARSYLARQYLIRGEKI